MSFYLRGRIKQALFQTVPTLDQNDRYVMEKCAGYRVKLLDGYPLVDSDTLAMVHWVLKKDLQQLAPGDFEVVRDRFAFVPKDDQP